MITRIREVRRARGMTLDEVARACAPPTTPQTIGRLETGTRTVSVGWLNRIASALGVDAADLVDHPERAELPVVAVLGGNGAAAPKRQALVVPPKVGAGRQAGARTGARPGRGLLPHPLVKVNAMAANSMTFVNFSLAGARR